MKKVLCLIISAIFVLSCFSFSAGAYSYIETGSSGNAMNPSNGIFQSAQNPKYSGNNVTISGSINVAKQVQLYHYEAPKSGYYMVYTTGTLDTFGKIYEENSTLWWNVHYDLKNSDDDSGSSLNCKMIEKFDKYEDYYIGIRAWGSKTGTFTLKIEPNLDTITSSYGGTWENSHKSNSAIDSKSYYTAAATKEYYRMLRDQQTQAIIRNAFHQYGTVGTLQILLNMGATAFTIVGMAFPIAGWVTAVVDITVGALEKLLESFYEDVNGISDIMNELESKCGCGYTRVYGTDIYHNPTSGLLITTNKNFWGNLKSTYSAYSSTTLYGESYYEGTWH